MTFREYIAQRRCGDNPQGDFVGDVRRDRNFPDVQSWPSLRLYLARRGACEEAVAAARSVWQGYRAALRRQAGGEPYRSSSSSNPRPPRPSSERFSA